MKDSTGFGGLERGANLGGFGKTFLKGLYRGLNGSDRAGGGGGRGFGFLGLSAFWLWCCRVSRCRKLLGCLGRSDFFGFGPEDLCLEIMGSG